MTDSRNPALMPNFLLNGVPEYPATAIKKVFRPVVVMAGRNTIYLLFHKLGIEFFTRQPVCQIYNVYALSVMLDIQYKWYIKALGPGFV